MVNANNVWPSVRWPAVRLAVLCCALLLILPLSGCRPNDKASVRGKVTLAGQPLADVLVMFAPEAGPGAGGVTNVEGTFELFTGGAHGKRVFTGRCKISINEAEAVDEKGNRKPVRFPDRYTSSESSGLTAELKPGPNECNFDLESE
jgi:hypothetical protein